MMLETINEYARELLFASEEGASLQLRFAEYYIERAEVTEAQRS